MSSPGAAWQLTPHYPSRVSQNPCYNCAHMKTVQKPEPKVESQTRHSSFRLSPWFGSGGSGVASLLTPHASRVLWLVPRRAPHPSTSASGCPVVLLSCCPRLEWFGIRSSDFFRFSGTRISDFKAGVSKCVHFRKNQKVDANGRKWMHLDT